MADPERLLALSYAPKDAREGLAALFALDDILGQILRATRDPLVGQMRLVWWHDALSALDTAPPPAEPVLRALAREVLPYGVTGVALAGMVEGWEVLLDATTPDAPTLERHAVARGVALFGAAATLLRAPTADPVALAGRGWALADLAVHLRDPAMATCAIKLARGPLTAATGARWSRSARPLGALAHIARMDLEVPAGTPRPVGSPRRVARLLWHRITGR